MSLQGYLRMNDTGSPSLGFRSARRPLAIATALLALALATPTRGRANQIQVTLDNDFFTTNSIDDDLYTSGVRVEYSLSRYDLTFQENAFTDSQRDLRFDETYLSLGRRLEPVGGWQPLVRVGVLRVGHGLFGQSVQNAVHDLIGDERVILDYIDETHLYPNLAVDLRRDFLVNPSLTIVPKVAIDSSFGFKSSAALSVAATWRQGFPVWLGIEVGGRYTDTDFSALEPWIEQTGVLWGVTIGLPSDLVLSWSYNQFGTKLQHFAMGYRWNPGRDRAAAGSRS